MQLHIKPNLPVRGFGCGRQDGRGQRCHWQRSNHLPSLASDVKGAEPVRSPGLEPTVARSTLLPPPLTTYTLVTRLLPRSPQDPRW